MPSSEEERLRAYGEQLLRSEIPDGFLERHSPHGFGSRKSRREWLQEQIAVVRLIERQGIKLRRWWGLRWRCSEYQNAWRAQRIESG